MTSLLECKAADGYDWTLSDVVDLDRQRKKQGVPLVYEKEVIYAGDHFMGDVDFSIDDQMIDHWELVCSEMIADGIEQPVTVDHTTNPEKRRGTVIGWKSKIDSKGRKGLFAEIKFRDAKSAKLASTAQVSLASPKVVKRGGKTYPRGIEHVAITDYPCILGLDGFTKLQLSEPLVLCEETKEGKKKECPECAKRKKMKAKREKAKRSKRKLLAFSETPEVINGAVRELAEKTGERIAVVPQVDGTLILAESMLTDDMNPTHLILCGANAKGGGGFQSGNTCSGGNGQSSERSNRGGAKMHNFKIDESRKKRWFGQGAGYGRIQDARSEVPSKSSNDWATDDAELMDGASALLIEQSAADILFGQKDSNGENYTELVESAGGDPYLVVIDSDVVSDGPGGEFLVANPQTAAAYSKDELQSSFLEWANIDDPEFDFDDVDGWETDGKPIDDQDNVEKFVRWLSDRGPTE